MSQIAIRAALEQAVNALSPALSTAWENVPFEKPAPTVAYQVVRVLFATPDNVEMGVGYRELGYMQVDLMYPRGAASTTSAGTKNAVSRAIALRVAFQRGTTLIDHGVTTVVSHTPEIGQPIIEDDRLRVPVKVPFFANIFDTSLVDATNVPYLLGEESGTGAIELESGETLGLEEPA